MRNQKLQGTAYDKRCQRRIYMRSHVDPTLAAFIVCGPLQFLVSYFCLCREIKISVRVRGLPIDISVEPLIIARNKGVEEWQLAIRFVLDGEGNMWVESSVSHEKK